MTVMPSTIAAVSTPPGKGGIGIVRISGPEAIPVAKALFRPMRECRGGEIASLSSHRLHFGHVVDPADGAPVDEVLMAVMKAPHSYTREDVVEFQAHGGPVILRRILELVLRAGARLADAGEFTKRAFLHGRIDLSQAEAVADMIEARTESARKMASQQLAGSLGDTVEALRNALKEILVQIEAGIDFPEEVGDTLRPEALTAALEQQVQAPLIALVGRVDHGRIFRDGLRLGIVGRPNVGKSSLMNRLIEQDRVIVTEMPGTTRDAVEESIDIGGMPVVITDTAGLHETDDPVERLGVEKSLEILRRSDMVLFVLDASCSPSDAESALFGQMPRDRTLLVLNKIDKVDQAGAPPLPAAWQKAPRVEVSALTNQKIDALNERIAKMALGEKISAIEFGRLAAFSGLR